MIVNARCLSTLRNLRSIECRHEDWVIGAIDSLVFIYMICFSSLLDKKSFVLEGAGII